MRFITKVESDIGNSRKVNQDSVLVKHATYGKTEVLLSIICDGMGGLNKGELASATVIRAFNEWFDNELPQELSKLDIDIIGSKFSLLIKDLNLKIKEFGMTSNEFLGTTFTGALFIEDQLLVVHVGDTRLYYIGSSVEQITDDQTVVAQEVRKGSLTEEEAENDKRQHILLQCVGASKAVEPQVKVERVKPGTYMLCSDGFRHKITQEEIFADLNPKVLINKQVMKKKMKQLIELVKQRGEKDNISLVLIKSDVVEPLPRKRRCLLNLKSLTIVCVLLFAIGLIAFTLGLLCL